MIIIYIILVAVSFLLLLINLITKLKLRKRLYRTKKHIKLDNFIIKYCLAKFNNHKKIEKIIDKYSSRLCLFNFKSKLYNEYIVTVYLMITISISFVGSLLSYFLFAMWYAPTVISVVSVFFLCYIGITYINIKLNKVYGQFPVALQIFTDEYVITKNIKNALNESYSKMPKEIGQLFENLSRKLDARNYNEVLKSFADGLDLIWCYAFVEILTLSYEGADDISEELIYLNELTGEEMKEDEETLASIAESQSIFIVLNVFTVAMFIINLVISANARQLYFRTSTGNAILLYWAISYIVGVCTSNLLKKI